jgi:two-component system KDP operon response regulator KdpE
VLVVDDDPRAARQLANILANRYEVRTTADADAALASVRTWRPALIITDRNMPVVDGLELCRRVRQISTVPIIVVSPEPDAALEVAALDGGADDYIRYPFGADTLLARMRVALRRTMGTTEAAALGVGEFHIDFHDRRVHVHGQPVRLTPKEFDLLVFMARHPNRVLEHRTLLGAVWGQAFEEQSEYLRVFVGQLRKKLESDPSNPRYFVTEPWVGYRFNPTGSMHARASCRS